MLVSALLDIDPSPPRSSVHGRCDADEALTEELRVNLTRLITYAKSANTDLQRQVAEKLANEAVKREYVFTMFIEIFDKKKH